jgi:heme exporter protein A
VALQLKASGISAERGGRVIFAGIDFAVTAGELLVLAGPNGAGKTTLLRVIAGFIDLRSGTIERRDGDEDRNTGEQSHYVGHQDAVKPALTVEENLQFWASFLDGGEVDRGVGAFGLEELRTLPAAFLSAGQRRRLALSRLLVAHRSLWLLDEPASGLDTASARRLRQHMSDHLARGGVIIAATHTDLGVPAARRVELGNR